MVAWPKAMRWCAAFTPLLWLSPGCNTVYDYPGETPETTAAACADQTDNDFDGAIDCQDPDCDGWCAESDVSSCADGRDNDGDGRVDGADPRCWPVVAPEVQRCASMDSVDFEERFDRESVRGWWHAFGLDSIATEQPIARTGRTDGVFGFMQVPPSRKEPAGLLSTASFEGDWSSFMLGFQARVSSGLLRVELVPSALVYDDVLSDGAEDAAVFVEVDTRASPRVRLGANGQQKSVALQSPSAWHGLQLITNGGVLELLVDGTMALELPFASLPLSRLAIRGERMNDASAVQLDDVQLQLGGLRPCGTHVPQVPSGSSCHLDPATAEVNVGLSVSVAAHEKGGLCALYSAGPAGQDRATDVQAWWSTDAKQWAPVGTLGEGASEQVVGAGIARDAGAGLWRAALSYQVGDGVIVRSATSEDCASWSELVDIATLPFDAEAPSYLVPGLTAPFEIYYTRPGTVLEGASLWRMTSHDAASFAVEPQPVAVFAADSAVHGPASLSRSNGNELVLIHKIAPATGMLGVGAWVARGEDSSAWTRVARWPLLEADPTRGGFDGDAIVSGTIAWQPDEPVLVYGAVGRSAASTVNGSLGPVLSTGTARLIVGDSDGEGSSALARPGLCGDGSCSSGEDCASCAVDCGVCEGSKKVAERFDDAGRWELMTTADEDTFHQDVYVSPVSERLSLSPGLPGWHALDLDEPLRGDFELMFDAQWTAPSDADEQSRCTVVVGLTLPDTTDAFDADGLFVELDQQLPCSGGAPTFAPHSRRSGKRITSLARQSLVPGSGSACVGAAVGYRGAWHRVRLVRQKGVITVSVSAPGVCETSQALSASLEYRGPFDGLVSIVAGWSGTSTPRGYVVPCADAFASLAIDNVVLRTLPCDEGSSECTDAGAGQSFCTDLASSPEHCGACNREVGVAELCSGGEAACGETECVVEGTTVCADLTVDPEHCGACGSAVGPLETCKDGFPRAAMVEVPLGFSIDATEVTRSQYAAWLATEPSTADQLPVCAWNDTFEPSCSWTGGELADYPVACVDWCDAYGYCAAIGKRLCGRVDGKPMSIYTPVLDSQWFAVCSSGGQYEQLYGPSPDPLACNTAEQRLPDSPTVCAPLQPVASFPDCQAPDPDYAGVFDLYGNVEEWLDCCVETNGADDICTATPASVCQEGLVISCEMLMGGVRASTRGHRGIRCCSR